MTGRPRFRLPPDDARRMHAAVGAWRRGDLASAEAGYRELAERHPRFADAAHYHGLLLFERGRRKRALAMLEKARALDPDNPGFLRNFGRVLRETGDYARSVVCLKRAHALLPDDAPTLVSLAQSLVAIQCGDDVTGELERYLDSAPEAWQVWMLLGECRGQGGDGEGALAAYAEGSRRAPPEAALARLMRADAARRASRYELAAREYEAVLTIEPRAANAELGLAFLASDKGDFRRAEALLESALEHEPALYGAWKALSDVRPATSAFLGELDAAVERAGEERLAWPLYFARAHVHEALAHYDRAFADYERGNRMRAASRPASPRQRLEYVRGLVANLDAEFASRSLDAPAGDGPSPIFICGMPRSGTTLVESMLAAHPEVSPGGEQTYIHDFIRRRVGRANLAGTGRWLRERTDSELSDLARGWRASLVEPAAGRARVTDKMPANIYLLGLIHVCFPDAPIVHMNRDARDTCFSCFTTAFSDGQEFSQTLAGTAHTWRLCERIMQHWRATLGAERIIEVEYERLVAEPEPEIRRLLAALELDWDARCLDFHRVNRKVHTASAHQVRRPLYTSSVGRWRHFERHLGPLVAALEAPPETALQRQP